MSLPSSPQAISHDFPSVHLVTVSPPSTLSSLQSRSFPTKLSPSYFPRFPLLPPCRRFHLAPSQRSSYFPRLPVLPSRSFPTELSPSYFPRFSVHPVVASIRVAGGETVGNSLGRASLGRSEIEATTCSLPTEPSPSYFPQFPLRPPSRRFRIAPLAAKSTKRERKHRRCFWEKHLKISKDKCQEMTSK